LWFESLKIAIRIELGFPLADLQRQSTAQVLLWSAEISDLKTAAAMSGLRGVALFRCSV
jgi:hypothetical protein